MSFIFTVPECVLCGERSSRKCPQCSSEFTSVQDAVYFCDVCSSRVHTKREHYVGHVELKEHLYLLSVICIENSHYVCFTRDPTAEAQKWIFFDSMASRKCELYLHNSTIYRSVVYVCCTVLFVVLCIQLL